MKFDPYAWNEVQPNEKVETGQGPLRVRCSAPAPLYVEAQGFEALAGVGTDHDIEVSETVTFYVSAPKGTRIFWMPPARAETVTTPGEESYTNIDRMPHESGMVAEVTRARRQLELERRNMLREIRAEAAKARASLKPAEEPAALVEAEGVEQGDEPQEATE